MTHSSSSSDDAITGINVTPLVDITLVLLIIFMVTAKLIAGQSVPLDLPKAATAGVSQTVLTVEIDDQGRVSTNGERTDDRLALERRAQRELGAQFDLRGFHNAVLSRGAVTMGMLDTQVRNWISANSARRRGR